MEKALFYKEWLKTRSIFAVALIVAVAMAGYVILAMNRLIEIHGVEHLWLIMLMKDNSFVDFLKYVPLAVGLAIGTAQMVPEMVQKRLKLTLHLPYPQRRLVALMLLAGIAELLVIYIIQLAMVVIYDASILPHELVGRVVLTMLPWYFAGFTAYLFVTAICLEGTWVMRIVLALLAVATLMIYFLQPALEAYNGMIFIMIVFVLLLTTLSFGSVLRFKEGRQD